MGRVVVVASGKGGVGKTTITANLAIALAKMKRTVCVVDGDFGLNNLYTVLGLQNRVVYDILDILKGKCRISQGLVKDPIYPNLYMLTSTKLESNRVVSIDDFKGLVMELEKIFDFCLIDAPAGLDYGFVRSISPAGEMLVVVTPTVNSVMDALKCISETRKNQEMVVRVVANRVRWNLIFNGDMLSMENIEDTIGEKIVGVVPESSSLLAGNSIKSITGVDSKVNKAFDLLAHNLIYDNHLILNKSKKLSKFFLERFNRRRSVI